MKRETLWQRLLEQARHLSTVDSRRPGEANLRRAVSAAYYALFHFIVDQATIDWFGPNIESRPLRDIIGRAYVHGDMKQACKTFGGGTLKKHLVDRLPCGLAIPNEIQRLAQTFRVAQEQRHNADYDLSSVSTFRRSDVLQLIEDIERVTKDWHNASNGMAARLFLASMLTWKQIESHG